MSSPTKRARPITTQPTTTSTMLHFYRSPALSSFTIQRLIQQLQSSTIPITSIETEWCFNVQLNPSTTSLTLNEEQKLIWLFGETFDQPNTTTKQSKLQTTTSNNNNQLLIEIGPRLCYSTPWATNAGSVLESCGLSPNKIIRVERSRRLLFTLQSSTTITTTTKQQIENLIHDRMTEQIYPGPLQSFSSHTDSTPFIEETRIIPLFSTTANNSNPTTTTTTTQQILKQVSDTLGLSFDDWDIEYYSQLFQTEIKRNPTDVELFDLAQSNSEHSRHWFFGGNMILNGIPKPKTLFQLVKETLSSNSSKNSIIAFRDNSSAICGFETPQLVPSDPTSISRFELSKKFLHGTLTAETHNFPTGVAPFEGAETGTGGRIRDVQCVGRGARVVAGTAAYCVGQLLIPGYSLPWENNQFEYPSNLAKPLDIEIQASNGASDYGNKFGEPVIGGFTRSFGLVLPDQSRREWIKPIMFTSGVGFLDQVNEKKGDPDIGMIITKIGGPAYRIGVGGGAASSRVVQGDSKDAELDFQAVQRGDAEMENKMNRVVRACAELGIRNPIISIHDQGAGGNGNVLKEICDPKGGEIFLRKLPIGDETMSARELWTAEYQENNAMLIQPPSQQLFRTLCERENIPFAFVGQVTDTGRVVVRDGIDETSPVVVDLNLERVLGKMPPKTFTSTSLPKQFKPLVLPFDSTNTTKQQILMECLGRVLRLVSVGSKRFLTNKVDRCVTGLVAQQQCVGPLHTPLADVGVLAQSWFDVHAGVATATGEQPIKGLISPKAGARMSVGEALTNLIWAKITDLNDVKCRGNWMWAAKLPGEACEMYDACEGLCEALKNVGVGMDGGKDSLSMACRVGNTIVKAPGEICVSVYAMCTDVTLTVTPDIKPTLTSNDSLLYLIDLSGGIPLEQSRLGGSSLAHVFGQLGDSVPDFTNYEGMKNTFQIVQDLIQQRLILAGHDRSDGGLLVTVLEMAFGGGNGCSVDLKLQISSSSSSLLNALFGEELGLVIQIDSNVKQLVEDQFKSKGIPFTWIGTCKNSPTSIDGKIQIYNHEQLIFTHPTSTLRDMWENTSFELEKLQCNPSCVQQEMNGLSSRIMPPHVVTFPIEETKSELILVRSPQDKPRVAILREEGSNGDREMAAAFYSVGFDVWDVAMNDLRKGKAKLDGFQGIAFVGGFSYADVFGSAKGWAAAAKFNPQIWEQFMAFKHRTNTFSLGVCNGCQLMALLGWVPGGGGGSNGNQEVLPDTQQPRFVHNESGRFECRFVSVRVYESNSIFLKNMEGSCLGVWIAHGEGKAIFPDSNTLTRVEENKLAPLRYVDDQSQPTQQYPLNPNGSTHGIAALASPDGRHFAMMPHPERCYRMFQLPWAPQNWGIRSRNVDQKMIEGPSPWTKLFQNAFEWAERNRV
jgi:phosphoribosylformylglycinamidine synthase